MNEGLLQFIWEDQLFDRADLLSTTGLKVEVLQSGTIQTGQGPDLNDARIRLDGQLWAGTVEVHLRSSEWYEHGHQNDPAYENVVLHVVLENDVTARTASGRKLPTLELQHRLKSDPLAAYKSLMAGKAWIPCENEIASVDPQLIDSWLDKLLLRRLERKTKLIQAELSASTNDKSEVFYRLLLRAFGLKENTEPCEMLARALPVALLRKYRNESRKLEALLFGQAGMLDTDLMGEYPLALQKEYRHLATAHGLRSIPVASWKFGRIRPSNFPTVRLALFAVLIQHLDGDLNRLLRAASLDELHALLKLDAPSEWDRRYTLDETSQSAKKRLGPSMRQIIITNAIVPFHFALGRYNGDQTQVELARDLLEQMPSANDRIIRAWSNIGLRSETMGRSQALIELRNEFCAPKKCLNCSIGMRLMHKTLG